MKEKIELNQSDMLKLVINKIENLIGQYEDLYCAFKHVKGKITIDPLIITKSHENFLYLKGDINRLLYFYNIFIEKTSETTDKK